MNTAHDWPNRTNTVSFSDCEIAALIRVVNILLVKAESEAVDAAILRDVLAKLQGRKTASGA